MHLNFLSFHAIKRWHILFTARSALAQTRPREILAEFYRVAATLASTSNHGRITRQFALSILYYPNLEVNDAHSTTNT